MLWGKICFLRLCENFPLLSTLPMMIQLSATSTNFRSKMLVCLFRKQLTGKAESFRNSNFDLNQEYKIVRAQNH